MQADLDYLRSLAQALARVKHTGQVRKGPAAEPYFNHVSRVANRAFVYATEAGLGLNLALRARIVAYLHDLLEDTNMTAADLRRVGFDWTTVDDVVALSREEYRSPHAFMPASENYFDFIERGTQDLSDEGLIVKLADLADNLSDDWGGHSLRARYIKADLMVRAELKNRGVNVARMDNPHFLNVA